MARCTWLKPRRTPLLETALAAVILAGLAASSAAAPPPEGSRHTIRTTGKEGSDAYVLTLGKDSLSTNLDFDSYARLRARRTGDFLWFRRAGATYVIDDPAMLRQAQALFGSLRALEPEQEAL